VSKGILREGRCLCGEVRISTRALGDEISACYCDNCLRWSGSVQMGIEVPRDAVTVTGPVKTHRSSHLAERAWCDTCGSALWFAYVEGPDAGYFEIAPGLFKNAGDARLTHIVYSDREPTGWHMGGDLDRMPEKEYQKNFPFLSEGDTP